MHGAFGTGKLLRTRLLSVLQTDDGRVFVGAVTPAELLRVAGATPASATQPLSTIRTRALTKRFRGGQVAVDQLDLDVPDGTVYGFLGPNGSGKTTTIRMVLGLAAPTSGAVELFGAPMPAASAAALPRVGALIEGPACYPFLTGQENLARLDAADPTALRAHPVHPHRRCAGTGRADRGQGKQYRAYSLGMRQRLGLAAALLRPRDLLVLDEPTNGLDPQGTREVRHADPRAGRRGHHRLRVQPPAGRGGADLHPRRRAVPRPAGGGRRGVGAARVPGQPAGGQHPGRPGSRHDPGRLGFTDVRAQDGTVSAAVGDVEPDVACAALVARRRAGARAGRRAALAGGGVRRAHRGGLRCRGLRLRRGRGPAGSPTLRLLGSELGLLLGRMRIRAGLVVLAAVPVLIAVVVRTFGGPDNPGEGPPFLSDVTQNGLFIAFTALTVELPLFLPLAVGVVAGDSVAGEAQHGHPALPAGGTGGTHPVDRWSSW